MWGLDVHPPGDGEGQSEEFGIVGVDIALLAVADGKVAIVRTLKLDSLLLGQCAQRVMG